MTKLYSITKKMFEEGRKVSFNNLSKLFEAFFNGVVSQFNEEYIHES